MSFKNSKIINYYYYFRNDLQQELSKWSKRDTARKQRAQEYERLFSQNVSKRSGGGGGGKSRFHIARGGFYCFYQSQSFTRVAF